MGHEERIQNLEEAVLLLSRAINRMIAAHKSDSRDHGRDERGSRASDHLINEAYGALENAVDLLSVKEHERT